MTFAGRTTLMRAATTALVVLLCAHASFAQQQDETIPSPKIVTVTPGDGQAVIGFVPPEQTSLEIRNYVVDCEQPDDIRAGVLEVVAEAQEAENGQTVTVQGLTNGKQYRCTMVARAVTDALIPRAINSDPSNPTPIFTPSPNAQGTIIVTPPAAETAPTQPQPAATEAPKATTPPLEAPGAPIITESTVNGDSVALTFRAPAATENSAPVTGYVASCEKADSVQASEPATKPVELPATATAALINGLQPGTYVCSVTAQSKAGASQPATVEAVIKAPEPPVVPPITDTVVLPEATVKETPAPPATTTPTNDKTEQPQTTQTEQPTEATQPTTTTTTTTTAEEEPSTTEEQPKDSAIRATTTGAILLATVAVAAFALI